MNIFEKFLQPSKKEEKIIKPNNDDISDVKIEEEIENKEINLKQNVESFLIEHENTSFDYDDDYYYKGEKRDNLYFVHSAIIYFLEDIEKEKNKTVNYDDLTDWKNYSLEIRELIQLKNRLLKIKQKIDLIIIDIRGFDFTEQVFQSMIKNINGKYSEFDKDEFESRFKNEGYEMDRIYYYIDVVLKREEVWKDVIVENLVKNSISFSYDELNTNIQALKFFNILGNPVNEKPTIDSFLERISDNLLISFLHGSAESNNDKIIKVLGLLKDNNLINQDSLLNVLKKSSIYCIKRIDRTRWDDISCSSNLFEKIEKICEEFKIDKKEILNQQELKDEILLSSLFSIKNNSSSGKIFEYIKDPEIFSSEYLLSENYKTQIIDFFNREYFHNSQTSLLNDLMRMYTLSDEIKKEICFYFFHYSYFNVEDMVLLTQKMNLDMDELLKDPNIDQYIKNGITEGLSTGNLTIESYYKENHYNSNVVSFELERQQYQNSVELLKNKISTLVTELKKEENFDKNLLSSIKKNLPRANYLNRYNYIKAIEEFNIDDFDSIKKDPEIRKIVLDFLKGISISVASYMPSVKEIIEIKNKFLSKEDLDTKEIQSIFESIMADFMQPFIAVSNEEYFDELSKEIPSIDFVNSSKIKSSAISTMKYIIANDSFSKRALEIKNKFNISGWIFENEVQNKIEQYIMDGNLKELEDVIMKNYDIPKDRVFKVIFDHAEYLLNNESLQMFINAIEYFNFKDTLNVNEDYKILKNKIIEKLNTLIIDPEDDDIRCALLINEELLETKEKNKLLSQCFDVFEYTIDAETYVVIKDLIENNKIDESVKDIVKHTGINGLNELKQYINSFVKEIKNSSFDVSKLNDLSILKKIFKVYTRFNIGAWGNHTDDWLNKILDTNAELKENDSSILELKPYYFESDIINVKTIDGTAQNDHEFPESFKNSYNKLKKSIIDTIELIGNKKSISDIVKLSQEKLEVVVAKLEEKKANLNQGENSEKILQNISNNINELKGLNLRSVADFENNFQILSKYDEFHDELREFVFFMSFKDHKNQIDIAKEKLNTDTFDMDNISWMIDFAEHITHKETMLKYLKDKNSIKAFRNIIKTKSLEDELGNIQKLPFKGTTEFQFTPTRGILMELSGHIGDACWASKYNCISKEFPNFTTIAMTQNPGNKFERLSGSCMVIETTDENDEEFLVIRGLNPIESVINQLSVEDFYNKFIEYMKTIANKANKKLAIVIDSHSGGSATNRPLLYQYLSDKKTGLQKINLKSDKDTTFNGYDIRNTCYLVE